MDAPTSISDGGSSELDVSDPQGSAMSTSATTTIITTTTTSSLTPSIFTLCREEDSLLAARMQEETYRAKTGRPPLRTPSSPGLDPVNNNLSTTLTPRSAGGAIRSSSSSPSTSPSPSPRVLGVIPARYGSSRFPGKPLALICGKPMIYHTFRNASKSKVLEKLVIATDDERIFAAGRGFGAEVLMTGKKCRNGTERCFEALQQLAAQGESFDIVVNVQDSGSACGFRRRRRERQQCQSCDG